MSPRHGTTSGPPRRIVVVLIDTLRADHLPFYGYAKPTSPVMAAFASQAQVYTRAFAHAPATKASCAARSE